MIKEALKPLEDRITELERKAENRPKDARIIGDFMRPFVTMITPQFRQRERINRITAAADIGSEVYPYYCLNEGNFSHEGGKRFSLYDQPHSHISLIDTIRHFGMEPFPWLFPDGAPNVNYEAGVRGVAQVLTQEKVKHVCLKLEEDEDPDFPAEAMMHILKSEIPGVQIYRHFGQGIWEPMMQGGDGLLFQFKDETLDAPDPAVACANVTRQIMSILPQGVKFVAAEFAHTAGWRPQNDWSREVRDRIATHCMSAGADGTLTGIPDIS